MNYPFDTTLELTLPDDSIREIRITGAIQHDPGRISGPSHTWRSPCTETEYDDIRYTDTGKEIDDDIFDLNEDEISRAALDSARAF